VRSIQLIIVGRMCSELDGPSSRGLILASIRTVEALNRAEKRGGTDYHSKIANTQVANKPWSDCLTTLSVFYVKGSPHLKRKFEAFDYHKQGEGAKNVAKSSEKPDQRSK
jgi:hypothetical protein